MYRGPIEAEVGAGVPAAATRSGGGRRAAHLLFTVEQLDALSVPSLREVESDKEPDGESKDGRHQGRQGQGLLRIDGQGLRRRRAAVTCQRADVVLGVKGTWKRVCVSHI